MKIVSWNCSFESGGFNENKRKEIKSLESDMYVIQECTYPESIVFSKEGKFAYHTWYGDGKDSCLGIGLFSDKFEIQLCPEYKYNAEFRYVVPYSVDGGKFILFAVWTKEFIKGDDTHRFSYDENIGPALDTYKGLLKNPCVIIGDFNTASNNKDDEHKMRYDRLLKTMPGFEDCSNGSPKDDNDTFWSDKEQKFYRDDFCFSNQLKISNPCLPNIPPKWENIGKESNWERKRWRGLSDHCPIVVDFTL
jgi:exonuclease III